MSRHDGSLLQLQEVDLSNSIVPTAALESILCHCSLLENVSLEGLQLSDTVIRYFMVTLKAHC